MAHKKRTKLKSVFVIEGLTPAQYKAKYKPKKSRKKSSGNLFI